MASRRCFVNAIRYLSYSAEVKQAVQAIAGRVDAIYISNDNTVVSAISAVTSVARKHKIPVMSADPSSAESCGVNGNSDITRHDRGYFC
jgi:ABC-type uncharacterized transport system substrate-binding protein